MTDKELLKLAAKSVGWTIEENGTDVNDLPWYWCHQLKDNWNPLTDNGDALRLAVKLGLVVDVYNSAVYFHSDDLEIEEHFPQGVIHDVYAATRRAIVRAAAEIGKTL